MSLEKEEIIPISLLFFLGMGHVTHLIPDIMIILFGVAIIVYFRRQLTNVVISLYKRKEFVVVYQRKPDTDFIEKFLSVPAPDFITKVGRARHDLSPEYAIANYKGRKYFYTDEREVIPKKLTSDPSIPDSLVVLALKNDAFSFNIKATTNEELLISSDRVSASLDNQIRDILYRKVNNWMFIALLVAFAIAIIVIVYDMMVIQKVSPLVDVIYQKITPANISITT